MSDGPREASSPAVSVVMPCYNDEKYVAEAIESILNQTFADFELIIVDDGSTDTSSKIIDEFARRDSRIRVLRNLQPTGRGAARNRGIAAARADLIIFQDSDDTSVPDRLELQLEYMRTHPEIGLVASPNTIMDEDGTHLGTRRIPVSGAEVAKRLRCHTVFSHCAAMYRTRIIKEIGGYRNGFTQAQDYDMLLRLTERTTIGVLHIPIYRVRQCRSRISVVSNRKHKLAFGLLAKQFAEQRSRRGSDDYEMYVRLGRMPPPAAKGQDASAAAHSAAMVLRLLDCCEYRAALRFWYRGVLEDPRRLFKWLRLLLAIEVHAVLYYCGALDWVERHFRKH